MIKYILLSIILTFLIGCHTRPSDNYDVYIDPSVNYNNFDHVEIIVSAFLEWEDMTGVHFNIVMSPTPVGGQEDNRIYVYGASEEKINKMAVITDKEATASRIALDCTRIHPQRNGSEIYLRMYHEPFPDSFRKEALHEIGHSIGLSHIYDGRPSIMCYHENCVPNHVTSVDVEQYNNIRN